MVQSETTAHQKLLFVPRLPRPRRLREKHRQPLVDARCRARGEVGVKARQIGQLLPQRVPVGGMVDRPVEGPVTPVQHLDDRLHGGRIDPAVHVQEPQHELLGPGVPHLPGRPGHPRDVPRREPVRQPQHHPHRDVHGGPDRGDRRDRRRQTVRRHVGHEFQPVRASGLGGDRVLGVQGDHLQDCTLAHGTPFVDDLGRLQV